MHAKTYKSALKWHGGKSYLAKRIVALMPPHKRYLEGFAGGMSVLLAKPYDGISEYANDLHGELINFWRVLQLYPVELINRLWVTPFSEELFKNAIAREYKTDLIRATAFFIANRQSRQGLGKDYATPTRRQRRGMNENVSAWLSAIDGLPEIATRLRRVELWNRPAIAAIEKLDGDDFFTYLDPPYMHETRVTTKEYAFEMTKKQHKALLNCLSEMEGKFMLSGYRSKLYDNYADHFGWYRHDILIPNNASSKREKEIKAECLWMNYKP